MNPSTWNGRSLASLMTAAGFLIMTLSGCVAFMVPHGRIAYWTDWRFLGLAKDNWADIHVTGCVLFLIAGGFHIYFNWRPLTGYFLDRIKGGIRLTKELAITVLVMVCVVLGAIYRIPPLSYISVLSESAKNSWVSREYEPPFGRAELVSFAYFCKKQDIPLSEASAALEKAGMKIDSPDSPLADIARSNGISPVRIYVAIKHLEGKDVRRDDTAHLTPLMVEERFAGSGVGRKTLLEVAASVNLDTATMRKRLEAMNLEVKDDESLKQAAERNGLQPIEMLKAVLIEGYKPR